MPEQVNVVWMPRVVVRENGSAVDVPHQFNPETGTHAVREDVTPQQAYDAGYVAGHYVGQQMPQADVDRLFSPLPMLDVNDRETLEEDGGLF